MFRKSDICIILAVAISFVVSAYFWFTGYPTESLFTAIWVPSILCFAIYFKAIGITAILKDTNKKKRQNDDTY